MSERSYKAIRSEELSKKYESRYVIVSIETGEILDDAQGHGYRTVQKAYAGYSYKTRSPEDIKKKEQKNAIIRKWCTENKGFVKTLDRIAFEIAKGSWAPDDKVNTSFVKKLFKESGYENLPFTAREFLTYWRKH